MENKYNFMIIIIILLNIFCWEHLSRKNDWSVKPSFFINELAEFCQTQFENIGYYFAKISSFVHVVYTYIDIEDLKRTFLDLINPTMELLNSPFYSVKGYFETINFYDYPYLILFGSIILMSIIGGLLGSYGKELTLKNLIEKYRSVRGATL